MYYHAQAVNKGPLICISFSDILRDDEIKYDIATAGANLGHPPFRVRSVD